MRKALILIIPILIILAVSIKVPGNITGFALEVPEGITGFFVQVTTSVISIVKEVVKQLLLAVANML